MEPIKFDDYIREQLQEREIQPSNAAWEKLNKELISSSKKKAKIPWYAIAASVVGLLVIASLVFSAQTNSIVKTNSIVETKTNTSNKDVQKELIFKTGDNKTTVVVETGNDEEKLSETPAILENKNVVSVNNTQIKNTLNHPEKNDNDYSNQKLVAISTDELNNSENDFLEIKVAEVVAEVVAIKKLNNSVSEDEINALLEKAQLEIQSQRILVNNRVDATALLISVEDELETTFRDKVFDALGEQFKKVRTAVIDLNN